MIKMKPTLVLFYSSGGPQCGDVKQTDDEVNETALTVVAVVALVVFLRLERLRLPVDIVVGHLTVRLDWRLPRDV